MTATTAYAITRPLMTRDELATHEVTQYGRNYAESCDGYEDMEAEQDRGWHSCASWGRDGWDLGNWPYVVIYRRKLAGGKFGVMQIVEGDRTVYHFGSEADRDAAIDYLFLWYAAEEDWAPLSYEDRARLDAGELTVDEKFRGPYREA